MADHQMGDTMKLVGAMMRLRHFTKFKSGLSMGGAPSSMASAREHAEFLRLFCRQMREQQEQEHEQEEEQEHQEEEGEAVEETQIAGDGDMLTAKFAETQMHALVNSELEACLVLHESQEFWQERLERSGAKLRNWIEMGPWTWKTRTPNDCDEEYLSRLTGCRNLLRIKILSAGSLQLHLTQMKQAYMEGTLKDWNQRALAFIQRALSGKGIADGITGANSHRRSLASITPSTDCRTSGSTDGGLGVAFEGAPVAAGVRRLSVLERALSLGRLFSRDQGEQKLSESRGDALSQQGWGENEGVNAGLLEEGAAARIARDREEGRTARTDLAKLLKDAQEDGVAGTGEEEEDEKEENEEAEGVFEALLNTSEELIAFIETQQEDMLPLLLGDFAPPSRIRRNWLYIAIGTPAVLAMSVYMYRNRSGIQRSLSMVRGSMRQFVREHISEPFWGIYNDLVHNQPLTMTDAKALADTSYSLERMLEAFIKDTRPEMSPAEVKRMSATGDMSVVSREYEKSIINAWKHFVAGDIVRMMLIQVQFIKRELLIATTAIGQLARENELNLRMMATVPAFLLAWASYRTVRPVYYMLKSEKSRESTFKAMRTIVLAMERLLNLRHRDGIWLHLTADLPSEADSIPQAQDVFSGRRGSLLRPSGHSDNCTRQVVVSAGPGQGLMAVRVLDELDLGKLMMLVHQLRRLIRSGPRRFQRTDLVNCQEDLAELVGERGLVSVGQQLTIVQRMQRSYKFLLPQR